MPDSKRKEKWRRFREKLRTKYRLVILNDDNFEERFSFRLTRLNVFVSVGAGAILIITITIFIIAFTPLREYIPGYTDVTLSRRVNMLLNKTDSLENAARQKSMYVENIRRVIDGNIDFSDSINLQEATENRKPDEVSYSRSIEDSLLRDEYYNETSYDLYYNENEELSQVRAPRSGYLFFTPLKGIVTSEFELSQQHYGIDIVSKKNEAVKATLDGTVIFAGWTIETGYTISVQHTGNFLSVYKHNAVLLKSQGNVVKAGDPIAIVGESGELSTGAHLHFELWFNGTPVDPREYIAF